MGDCTYDWDAETYESTDGRLRTWAFLIFDNDVIIVMAARWLPNNEEFFVGLVRLLEASESNLNSASYDNSEFLFRRLDAHEKTLSTLLTVLTSLYDSCSSRMNKSLHSLALTRMSFRDFLLRYEMMGCSLKISLSCGWFSIIAISPWVCPLG